MNEPSRLLEPIARELSMGRGDSVFHEGDPATAVYQVMEGEVQLYRHASDGKRILLHRALNGHFFADASLNSDVYHCTAVCTRAGSVKGYESGAIRDLLRADPDFALWWVERLSAELRRQRASVERLCLNTTAERIRHLLLTEGGAEGVWRMSGSLTDLAERLGVSRESLYRTLARMEADGQVLREHGVIRII